MICLRDRRCALCRFEINNGDVITVKKGDSLLEFELQRHEIFSPSFNLGNEDFSFHLCFRSPCGSSDHQVLPYLHRACRRITQIQLSADLLSALAFSFSPDSIDTSRREKRLQSDFALHARGSEWPRQLPTELWHLVADYFSLKEYAALVAERLSLKLSTPGETVLDLSLPINVTYRMIDGARYISGLRNGEGVPATAKSARRVEIGEDYCGVRQLRLYCGPDVLVIPEDIIGESRIWWSVSSGHQFLRISYDGLKVRQIRPDSPTTTDHSYVGVSEPAITPVDIIKLSPNPSFDYSKIWMQPLRCNYPDVRGYFAQLCRTGTITIHEHVDRTDTRFFSQSQRLPGESRVWVYMPMGIDEYLVAVCIRVDKRVIGRRISAADTSLIVSKYYMLN
ncbi:hypothetical protein QBC46DRAFT_272216 [Diplogelasinospora grovesii]|uniref:Uncharacterized protein n=1 Tax=Diplogelasinospora grovesii TaxID=303347 RepID=A0AAN6MZU1_9PEZI|nr:hypothetical protein QBC46DRAFT_272216 [Diplogelasinospora grovesii]